MFHGHFVHENITASNPIRNEALAGAISHYFTGGSVALLYPAYFLVFNLPLPENHLIPGLVFGLATVLLPWLVLYPGFGYGFFGVRAPLNSRPLIAPAIEHMLYGLGMGIVFNLSA
jgi:hypothetical protein